MLIWDNRATQHAAIGDAAPGEPRILHRVTIAGAAVLSLRVVAGIVRDGVV